jgi:hypothetical protein
MPGAPRSFPQSIILYDYAQITKVERSLCNIGDAILTMTPGLPAQLRDCDEKGMLLRSDHSGALLCVSGQPMVDACVVPVPKEWVSQAGSRRRLG